MQRYCWFLSVSTENRVNPAVWTNGGEPKPPSTLIHWLSFLFSIGPVPSDTNGGRVKGFLFGLQPARTQNEEPGSALAVKLDELKGKRRRNPRPPTRT